MNLSEFKHRYINLEYLLEVADGDDEFIEQTLSTYLSNIPENIAHLQAAFESGDAAQILFYAHSLKGAFTFVGSSEIAGLFSSLEICCQDKAHHYEVPGLMAQILPLAPKATAELQAVLADVLRQRGIR